MNGAMTIFKLASTAARTAGIRGYIREVNLFQRLSPTRNARIGKNYFFIVLILIFIFIFIFFLVLVLKFVAKGSGAIQFSF